MQNLHLGMKPVNKTGEWQGVARNAVSFTRRTHHQRRNCSRLSLLDKQGAEYPSLPRSLSRFLKSLYFSYSREGRCYIITRYFFY